jgi:hypothetical protein
MCQTEEERRDIQHDGTQIIAKRLCPFEINAVVRIVEVFSGWSLPLTVGISKN